MSMYMTLNTISTSDIEAVKSVAMKLERYHYDEIFEEDLDDLSTEEKIEILNWSPNSNREEFQIGGDFEAINYLLTGHKDLEFGYFPLNFPGEHGTPLAEIGWGQANLYNPEEVLQIFNALKSLDSQYLIKNYNQDIYDQTEFMGVSGKKVMDQD